MFNTSDPEISKSGTYLCYVRITLVYCGGVSVLDGAHEPVSEAARDYRLVSIPKPAHCTVNRSSTISHQRLHPIVVESARAIRHCRHAFLFGEGISRCIFAPGQTAVRILLPRPGWARRPRDKNFQQRGFQMRGSQENIWQPGTVEARVHKNFNCSVPDLSEPTVSLS